MKDKQTIIDGCDVSGCEWYSKHREGYCSWHTPCNGDTCSYKLKWALQQLEQLKKHYEQQLKAVIDKHNELLKENKTKGAELMQLRRTLNEIKSLCYEQDLNEDFFACEVLQKISEVENG